MWPFSRKGSDAAEKSRTPTPGASFCSFCGKSQHDVLGLVAGPPPAFICNECVELCIETLDELPALKGRLSSRNTDVLRQGLTPLFKRTQFAVKRNHVFYACPYDEPFNSMYREVIAPAIVEAGWTVERADDVYVEGPVVEHVWERINESTLIIADVSGRNPNVMYEVGISHSVGRPVMLVTQTVDDIPFDLRHLRFVEYENSPAGYAKLVDAMKAPLQRHGRKAAA